MSRTATAAIPTFSCAGCGLVQERRRMGNRGFAHHQRFCTKSCAAQHPPRRPAATVSSRPCEECGVTVTRQRRFVDGRPKGWNGLTRFCNRACSAKHTMRASLGAGAGYTDKHGYRLIRVAGVEIPEHRYVMERHLGRKLRPEETVHHRDGDRAHNDIGNLELWSSRHGKGQRVTDKVAFAIEMLRAYPDVAAAQGARLTVISPRAALTAELFDTYGSTMAAAIKSWAPSALHAH